MARPKGMSRKRSKSMSRKRSKSMSRRNPKRMPRKRSKSMSRRNSKSMSRRNPKGMKKAKGIKDWTNWLGLTSKDKVNTTSISPSPAPPKGPLTRLQAKRRNNAEKQQTYLAQTGIDNSTTRYSQAEMKEFGKKNLRYYV